jgi:hypothetical protein
MNTCDPALVWTTDHCNDQDTPQLTVQNVTFVDGNATGLAPEGAGGAIFARGGRFKAVNARFFRNVCDPTGPDVGGGAIRVFDQARPAGLRGRLDLRGDGRRRQLLLQRRGALVDRRVYTVALCGVSMTGNTAREGGGAVFYVSNDRSGHLWIGGSTLSGNPSAGFEMPGYPGIFYEGAGPPIVRGSTLAP